MDDRIAAVAESLRDADAAAALTGAGVSTASGVPSFRGEDGIWNRYDQGDFDIYAFERDPGAYWERRLELHEDLFPDGVEPNAAHEALSALESSGHLDAVVTQNVDGLHDEAGAEELVTLHGRADRVECRACGGRFDAAEPQQRAHEGELPPRCPDCDGVLKPGTVLFGERLPRAALSRAQTYARDSDVFLVAGTSLTVEPAASLPVTASTHGAAVVLVNAEATPKDSIADFVFHADVTEVLPRLQRTVVEG